VIAAFRGERMRVPGTVVEVLELKQEGAAVEAPIATRGRLQAAATSGVRSRVRDRAVS